MFAKNFLFVVLLLSIEGCKKRQDVTRDELIAYTLDKGNGLIQTTRSGSYQLDLTYRPTDLMVFQELGHNISDTSRINQLRTQYANYFYFLFQVSKNESEILNLENGQDHYSQLLQTLAFHMPQYVLAVQGSDTTKLSDFMLDRTYGMSSSTNLLLVFERSNQSSKGHIFITVNEFGLGIGSVKFKFKLVDLEKAPNIKFGDY